MLPRSYPFRDGIRAPFSDTRLTEMRIAEGGDSLSGPLAGGCGFCVAAGWRLFTEPRLRDHMLCRERGEIKKALSIAVSARQRGIRGSSPPVVEAATTCPGPLSRLWIPPPAPSFRETPLEQVLPGRLGHQE